MAYAFDRTMNALGKQPATGKVDEPTQLSSDAGALGGGNSNGVTPNAAPVRSSPGSSKQAFNANRDRAVSPVNIKGLNDRISTAKTGLYGQQGAYLANAGKQYDDAQPSLANDVSGYLANGSNGNNFKERYTTAPGLNEDIKLDPDKNLRDVNALANDASIRNRIRENSGAESRLGDSALDVSILHANKWFNVDRDKIGRDYGDEEAARKDIQASSRGLADREADRKYQFYRGRVNSLLGDAKTAIQAHGEDAMGAYNRAAGVNASDAVKKRAAEKAALTEAGLDASGDNYDSADEQYFNPSAASTDWTQHVSADDAARWKRTMDLLGGAGPASLSGSKFGTANNDLGFSKDKYISDQRTKRAAAETASAKAIDDANRNAVVGSTGISEMPIPGREDPYPWATAVAGPDKGQHNDSQYGKTERAILGSRAVEELSQLDPSNLVPSGYKPAKLDNEWRRGRGYNGK